MFVNIYGAAIFQLFLRQIVDNDEGRNISNTCKHADCWK